LKGRGAGKVEIAVLAIEVFNVKILIFVFGACKVFFLYEELIFVGRGLHP